MNWLTDEEVKELFNKTLPEEKKRKRETITRWRNGSRSPKLSDILTIEKNTHIPFEAFMRNADLEQIELNMIEMLKNLRLMIKEKNERIELKKELDE
jgi:transcriptional regulator with XRE-family HTH domain